MHIKVPVELQNVHWLIHYCGICYVFISIGQNVIYMVTHRHFVSDITAFSSVKLLVGCLALILFSRIFRVGLEGTVVSPENAQTKNRAAVKKLCVVMSCVGIRHIRRIWRCHTAFPPTSGNR